MFTVDAFDMWLVPEDCLVSMMGFQSLTVRAGRRNGACGFLGLVMYMAKNSSTCLFMLKSSGHKGKAWISFRSHTQVLFLCTSHVFSLLLALREETSSQTRSAYQAMITGEQRSLT